MAILPSSSLLPRLLFEVNPSGSRSLSISDAGADVTKAGAKVKAGGVVNSVKPIGLSVPRITDDGTRVGVWVDDVGKRVEDVGSVVKVGPAVGSVVEGFDVGRTVGGKVGTLVGNSAGC